ncbi:DUF4350 domain-containing protein [Mesonia maritima]|uniref:DUF4350 domain-containing protein n=2 Tax=Mesonia maritima TaxID=1793873 RepID=A0ABU1K5J9_9FLAO|nr:DUF4350 domain-containing protein [Mesonia maritima]MDR6300864.1 hypothetical protein [Mesonia maritima]
MSKNYKITLGSLILLLALLVYFEASKPEPVNWFPSYSENDKIPLGTYVFYENLSEKADDLRPMEKPPYTYLNDSLEKGTYFFISHSLYFDNAELNELLNWVSTGNTVFLAANDFKGKLLDTLHIEQRARVQTSDLESHPHFNLVNPDLKNAEAFEFSHDKNFMFFREIDTASQTVLGVGNLKDEDQNVIKKPLVNFIKAPFGEGKIYLHSSPEVFSNYFLLTEKNYQYTENLLAYLDLKQPLFWDKNYKLGKTIHTSPLYILLNSKYLKWAYYFTIIGVILFILFEGKRKQKSIKVVKPLKNQTYDYTRTIAGMYLDKKDHKAIADKQIDYFLYFIRTKLRTDTHQLDQDFYNTLAERTNYTVEEVESLFQYIINIQQQKQITKNELIELNKKITSFKKNA